MKQLLFALMLVAIAGCAAIEHQTQIAEIQSIWEDATVIPVQGLTQSTNNRGYIVIDKVGNVYFIDFTPFGERKPEVLLHRQK